MTGWTLDALPDVQPRTPRRSLGVIAGATLSLVLHGLLLMFLMLPAKPGVPRLLLPPSASDVTWLEFLPEAKPEPRPAEQAPVPRTKQQIHSRTPEAAAATASASAQDILAIRDDARHAATEPAAEPGAGHATGGSVAGERPGEPAEPAPAAAPVRGYVWDVLAHLAPHQHYPPRAQRRGHEGTVLVRARVSRRGVVLKAEVRDSSGHRSLDNAALALLQAASPLPPPPPGPTAITELDLPIVYTLKPR